MKKILSIFLLLVLTTSFLSACGLNPLSPKNLANKIIENFTDDPAVVSEFKELEEATAPTVPSNTHADIIKPSDLFTKDEIGQIIGASTIDSSKDIVDSEVGSTYIACEYNYEGYQLLFNLGQDAQKDKDMLDLGYDTYFMFNKDKKLYYDNQGLEDKSPSAAGLGEIAYFDGAITSENGPWSLNVYENGYSIKIRIKDTTKKYYDLNSPQESDWEIEKLTEIAKLVLERLRAIIT